MSEVAYIKGKEILEKEISFYEGIQYHRPIGRISIKGLFDRIRHNDIYTKQRGGTISIYEIREIYRKYGHKSKEYNAVKRFVPCVTPSGVFTYANNNSLVTPSNLLVLDIDDLNNGDIERVKKEVFALPYVYSVSVSLSGSGLWAIIPIDPNKDRVKIFDSINQEMKLRNIKLDKLKDITRLRLIAYDPDPLVKPDDADVVIYDKELDLSLFTQVNKQPSYRDVIQGVLFGRPTGGQAGSLKDDDNLCYYAAKYAIEKCGASCTANDNNMNVWLGHLGTLAELGDMGLDLALTLSRQSSSYVSDEEVERAFKWTKDHGPKDGKDSRDGFLKYFSICKKALGEKIWISKLKEMYNF